MNDPKVGKVIVGPAFRDAIHMAVAPIIAGEELNPGDHVGFLGDDKKRAWKDVDKPIGIVDPFLKEPVIKGQKFWLFLYPKTVTSLRHAWSHPDFDDDEKQKSRDYIDALAGRLSVDVRELINTAIAFVRTPEGDWPPYLVGGSNFVGESTPPEFWGHFEIVTGIQVPEEKRVNFFSCSC